MSTVAQEQRPTSTAAAPKVILNNRCKGRAKIDYITKEDGPKHLPTFNCDVQVNGTTWGRGAGASKKEAEQAAAAAALRYDDERGAFNAL